MQIQWKEKWLSFTHQNSTIRLHGVQDDAASANEITACHLIAMEKQEAVWGIVELYSVVSESDKVESSLPLEIQELII
jgi:hypothetical protein